MSKSQARSLNIELPADLEPTYANFALISHTPSEVIIDLAQMLPNQQGEYPIPCGDDAAECEADAALYALQENLGKYEATYGEIRPGQGDDLVRSFFGGKPSPEAE